MKYQYRKLFSLFFIRQKLQECVYRNFHIFYEENSDLLCKSTILRKKPNQQTEAPVAHCQSHSSRCVSQRP